MRQARAAVVTLLSGIVLAAGAGVAAAGQSGQAVVLPVPMVVEASRVQTFTPDLNRDGVRETVLVYNFDQDEPTPKTFVTVFQKVPGGWVQRSTILLFGPSPGNIQSGLVRAWAGDLNGDGRFEVMTRNSITASAGETMMIARQRAPRSLKLVKLQGIPADAVNRAGPTRSSVVTALIRPNHSADGRRHVETWRWSARAGRWVCSSDCTRGIAEAGVAKAKGYATAENAAVLGLLKVLPGSQRPISSRRRRMLPDDPHRAPNTQLWVVTFESFTSGLPALPPGVHTRFSWVRKIGGRWRLIAFGTGP